MTDHRIRGEVYSGIRGIRLEKILCGDAEPPQGERKQVSVLAEIGANQVLMSGAVGWLVAQALKTGIDFAMNRSFNPERLTGSGGMPSSHSATVCGMTTAAFLRYGAGSFEFAISFLFAAVVMYDATGVRRETGKQAKILNKMLLEDLFNFSDETFTPEKLKEYVGHTPLQVWCGAILGIFIAIGMDPMFS